MAFRAAFAAGLHATFARRFDRRPSTRGERRSIYCARDGSVNVPPESGPSDVGLGKAKYCTGKMMRRVPLQSAGWSEGFLKAPSSQAETGEF